MRIEVKCPNRDCGKTLLLTREMAGKTGKCANCGKTFQIPKNLGTSQAAPKPPPAAETPPPAKAAAKPAARTPKPSPATRKAPPAGSRPAAAPRRPAGGAPRRRPAGGAGNVMDLAEFKQYLVEEEELDTVEFLDEDDLFDDPPPRRRRPRDEFEDYDDFGLAAPVARPRRSPGPARKRRVRKHTGPALSSPGTIALIGLGLLLLLFGVAFAVPALAWPVTLCFAILGGSLAVVGGVWSLMLAFEEDTLCGLLYWFVPFYSLYYVVTRFDEQKRPLLFSLCGVGLLLVALMISAWALA